jgi:hypothetical protein
MQTGVRRFPRFLLRLVLSGLSLAALAPVGPAIAGEVGVEVPAVAWQRLPTDDGEVGFRRYPAGFRGLTGFELVLREADDGVPWRGLFFRVGGGLRIGAQGSFEPGSGNLRAIIALKLNF